jgi:hypothetical protein
VIATADDLQHELLQAPWIALIRVLKLQPIGGVGRAWTGRTIFRHPSNRDVLRQGHISFVDRPRPAGRGQLGEGSLTCAAGEAKTRAAAGHEGNDSLNLPIMTEPWIVSPANSTHSILLPSHS